MIHSQTHKGESGPPDGDDLAKVLPRHSSEKASKTDQPIGTDSTKENLMPFGRYRLRRCEFLDLGLVCCGGKDATVAGDQRHDEEGAGEVAPERDEPMHEHLPRSDTAVQTRDRGEHEGSGTEVGAGQDDRDEAEGEDDGANHADQAGCVVLVPWCSVCAQSCCARECEKASGHEATGEDFVYPHVCLGYAGSRADLDGFYVGVYRKAFEGAVAKGDEAVRRILSYGGFN